MSKGECKAIEALLDVLKTLFNVWSVFTLAWAGALGSFLKSPPKQSWLVILSSISFAIFAIIWLVIVLVSVKLALKLKNCEED